MADIERRRRHRHRLRRLDPRLLPRRRRRARRHARARAAPLVGDVHAEPAARRLHAPRRPRPRHRLRRHRRQLRRRRQPSSTSRRHSARRASCSSAWGRSPSACGRPRSRARALDRYYTPRRARACPSRSSAGATCRTRAASGARRAPRRLHLQSRPRRRRPEGVHQLQLDAERLRLRRQALDAAQLPPGRRSVRLPRSARSTRCRRSARHDRAATATRSTTCSSIPTNYSTIVGTGTIEAKIVILAAGAMGTPVILQRSAALLGGDAGGGRTPLLAERRPRHARRSWTRARSASLLGLERAPGVAYEGYAIGRPIGSMSFDSPRRESRRVLALLARSRSTSRRSRASSPRTAAGARRPGSASTSATSPTAGARGSRSSR